jgi:hypothetical protein
MNTASNYHQALSHAKALLHSEPIRDSMNINSGAAAMELRQDRDPNITGDIAQIEQALREHGCTV